MCGCVGGWLPAVSAFSEAVVAASGSGSGTGVWLTGALAATVVTSADLVFAACEDAAGAVEGLVENIDD